MTFWIVIFVEFFTDDLSNSLYWSDAERSTIEVYSFDTQHRAVVQNFLGEETPIALAAIPEIEPA